MAGFGCMKWIDNL